MTDDPIIPSPRRGKNRPSTNALVALEESREQKARAAALERRPDDRIPDEVWLEMQDAGVEASKRFLELLKAPNFKTRKFSEQLKLIEIAFNRAYGTADGGIKRTPTNVKVKMGTNATRPEVSALGNSLARLAKRAQFPELRQRDGIPPSGETTEPEDE